MYVRVEKTWLLRAEYNTRLLTTTQKIGKTVGYICCCVHGYSFLNVYEVSGRENRNQKRRNFPKVIPCVYLFKMSRTIFSKL